MKKIIVKIIIWKYKVQCHLNKWLRSIPFFKKILVWLTLLKADIQLKYAVMEAHKKYALHNKRYYVIPNLDNRLITHNRAELRKLRTQGYFGHDARMPQFFEECFYCTPQAFGKEALSNKEIQIKRMQWLDYILQVRNLK